jgi:hypothetical protein
MITINQFHFTTTGKVALLASKQTKKKKKQKKGPK